MSAYTTAAEFSYSMPQVVYVGPDKALAERNQAQQEQIEFLSRQSTRLLADIERFKRTLAHKDMLLEERRERDKRLCYHIRQVQKRHAQASFSNPEGKMQP